MTDVVAAADTIYAIPLAALIVSASALVWGFKTGRTSELSSVDQALQRYNETLRQQLAEAREDIKECSRRCRALERQNTDLASRLYRLEQNGGDH